MDNKLILDVCCAARQFWFDKDNSNTVYCDIRKAQNIVVGQGENRRVRKIRPDLVMDFRDLKFENDTFQMVVFDPPHLFVGETSFTAASYGRLDRNTYQEDIRRGFSECFRVLKPKGTLIFKWNEYDVLIEDILKLCEYKPLFGHPSGKAQLTHWITFMKLEDQKKEHGIQSGIEFSK